MMVSVEETGGSAPFGLDPDACYAAIRTRDGRLDGRFFVAVTTTGVFCRVGCPAPLPKRINCRFFPTAAAACEAGFRPCLRCRPEASPGSPLELGTEVTVRRAIRLIESGALDGRGTVESLAERLGVSGRHLRRLFARSVGATPIAFAQTRRILFAKKLLSETQLPMTQVALASGFGSLRRFNTAMRETYQRTPKELRRGSGHQEVGGATIELSFAFREPFDWESMTRFFGFRALHGLERVDATTYCRVFRLGPSVGWFAITKSATRPELRATIGVDGSAPLAEIARRIRRMFDLDASPYAIDAQLSRDPRLRGLVEKRPGLRVPGAWDPFELAVRAIVGQQVSVAAANTLARRLLERFGEEFSQPTPIQLGTPTYLFPTSKVLASADLAGLGLTPPRARAIGLLARAVQSGEVVLDGSAPVDEVLRALCAIPSVGSWTAQYIAMRAMAEPDAFPDGDLVLRRRLDPELHQVSRAELSGRAAQWSPWRAYGAMHLWTE